MHLFLLQDVIESLVATAKALLIANIIVVVFLVFDLCFRIKEWNEKYRLFNKIVNAAKKATKKIKEKIKGFKLNEIFNCKKEIEIPNEVFEISEQVEE